MLKHAFLNGYIIGLLIGTYLGMVIGQHYARPSPHRMRWSLARFVGKKW